ncbi:hypothetical protein ABEF95_002257 [Exophiala dermatitidis]
MDTKSVISLVDQLEDNIDDLEENLQPLIEGALATTAKRLPLLDRAKLNVLLVYSIESLIFSYLKLQGVDAKDHAVFRELTRVKQYFEKIKEAETGPTENETRPKVTLDKEAAGRFIKHALAGNEKYDLERAEREARERALANKKLRTLEGNMKAKAETKAKEENDAAEEDATAALREAAAQLAASVQQQSDSSDDSSSSDQSDDEDEQEGVAVGATASENGHVQSTSSPSTLVPAAQAKKAKTKSKAAPSPPDASTPAEAQPQPQAQPQKKKKRKAKQPTAEEQAAKRQKKQEKKQKKKAAKAAQSSKQSKKKAKNDPATG